MPILEAEHQFNIAKEIGLHAEAEAFATLMRITGTAPNADSIIIALAIAAPRLQCTVQVVLRLVEEADARLGAVTRKAVQMASEVNG